MMQSSHGGKKGPGATPSISFPNIHPWACNLSCWQRACD